MNCKQGDLAQMQAKYCRIGYPSEENLGRVFRCLELIPSKSLCYPHGVEVVKSIWVVNPCVTAWNGDLVNFVPDYMLRPIRDPGDDARDQTLEWLPVPKINKTKETT